MPVFNSYYGAAIAGEAIAAALIDTHGKHDPERQWNEDSLDSAEDQAAKMQELAPAAAETSLLPSPTWMVGAGNMGQAVLAGWRAAGVDLASLTVIRPSGSPVEGPYPQEPGRCRRRTEAHHPWGEAAVARGCRSAIAELHGRDGDRLDACRRDCRELAQAP